jgi:hypothetical protein
MLCNLDRAAVQHLPVYVQVNLFAGKVEITPLMSFRHFEMLISASKYLKITLKFIKFSKPEEKKFPPKPQVDGGISPPHVKFMPGVNPPIPPLYETLIGCHFYCQIVADLCSIRRGCRKPLNDFSDARGCQSVKKAAFSATSGKI